MPTPMDTIVGIFQAIGRQEQNATLIHMAAERLRGLGMAVKTNVGVEYSKRGCPTRGHIDLAVVNDGVTIAIEIDHSRPRRNSLLKLRESDARFKLVILTSPGALAEPPRPQDGISVVVLDEQLRREPPAPAFCIPKANAVYRVNRKESKANEQSGQKDWRINRDHRSTTARSTWLAATAGDAEAQFQIGVPHANGSGVSQDFEIAAEWSP